MKPFFLLLWLGLVSLSANAQTAKELPEAVAKPIPYVRSVPVSIRARAKKLLESKFFGRFGTGSRAELAIHLYSQPVEDSSTDANGRLIVQPFRLDVFERQKGQKRWSQLNSTSVSYESHEHYPPKRFGASFLWLDERNKSVPILKLNCYGEGMYGDFGDDVLVVFPDGWRKPAAVQAFGYGADQSSDNYGQGRRFERNANGMFQVRMSYSSNNITREELWRWNGQQFAVTKQASPPAKQGTQQPQP